MQYRPFVWVTNKLWVKINSSFVTLCCTELRCQEVSHAKRQRIPILNHCNQSLQQDQCNFAETEYDDIISIARLQEEECSSDCFRKFYSRRKSRRCQRRTLRDPGDPWKLLRPKAKAAAALLWVADPTSGVYSVEVCHPPMLCSCNPVCTAVNTA